MAFTILGVMFCKVSATFRFYLLVGVDNAAAIFVFVVAEMTKL